jgi:hypothetical protein
MNLKRPAYSEEDKVSMNDQNLLTKKLENSSELRKKNQNRMRAFSSTEILLKMCKDLFRGYLSHIRLVR